MKKQEIIVEVINEAEQKPVFTLSLSSLPTSVSEEVISCYFEDQGEDIDVKSVKMLEGNKAIVTLSGITECGEFCKDGDDHNPLLDCF